MEETYITLVGLKYYKISEELKVGEELICLKDYDNKYDQDAIGVLNSNMDMVGYIANSPYTVAKGTKSASRIYDNIGIGVCIKVIFLLKDIAICQIIEKVVPNDILDEAEYIFEDFYYEM